MLTQSARLGVVEHAGAEVILFPNGLPAFEHCRRFLIVRPERLAPIAFLQSVELASLSLPIVDASLVAPDYFLQIGADDCASLGAEDEGHGKLEVFFVLALLETEVTVNLAAPLVIDRFQQLGVQAVRADCVYSAVHPLPLIHAPSSPC